MKSLLPEPVTELIAVFGRLPGVGPKMATRLAFYLLQKGRGDVERLSQAIAGIVGTLTNCSECGLISDNDLCPICADESRPRDQICVVEDSLDVLAFERAGVFQGRYHVLGGTLSPINGIGPNELRIDSLLARLNPDQSGEVVVAVNPSLEGEATADYLKQRLAVAAPLFTVTRIAHGLPMGSDVEYADPTTLRRALEGRREVPS